MRPGWGGFFIGISVLSSGSRHGPHRKHRLDKPKHDAPISGDRHGMKAFVVATQYVQPEPCDVAILDRPGCVEGRQSILNANDLISGQTPHISVLK
jgi:hypothetical protein